MIKNLAGWKTGSKKTVGLKMAELKKGINSNLKKGWGRGID
jgi:hypothetical protein